MKKSYTEEEYREAAIIWKKENPTLEMIPQRTVITISNGTKVPIGSRMNTMRGKIESLTQEQIKFWSDYGLMAEKKERYKEEEYREAAIIWKEENQDLELIPATIMITIKSGKKIPLGRRMAKMRNQPERLEQEQIEFWKDYGLMRKKQKREIFTEEEYREAALIWRKKNPKIDMIPYNEVITISSGIDVNVGMRMVTMRQTLDSLSSEQIKFWADYGLMKEKQTYIEDEYREAALIWRKENQNVLIMPFSTVVTIKSGRKIFVGKFLERMRHHAENLTKEQQDFWRYYGLFYKNEKAEKLVGILNNIKEKRRLKRKEEGSIDSILNYLKIDIETLEKHLNKTRTAVMPRNEELEYQGMSLKEYCNKNKYNYELVSTVVKLKKFCKYDSFEQLINRAIITNKNNQTKPSTWIYEVYGNSIKYILIYLNLKASNILLDMTKNTITLEKAIRHYIFEEEKTTKYNNYLEEIYNYTIEKIIENKEQRHSKDNLTNLFAYLIEEYDLPNEKSQILINAFKKYINIMREYQKIDVGLETNNTRRIEKIKDYNLDEVEIEESFYIPLEFDKGVLLGRQSELYKRRQLLRQYTIDWDYYTELEKEEIKLKNKFTQEEMLYIERMRNNINFVVEEVKKVC